MLGTRGYRIRPCCGRGWRGWKSRRTGTSALNGSRTGFLRPTEHQVPLIGEAIPGMAARTGLGHRPAVGSCDFPPRHPASARSACSASEGSPPPRRRQGLARSSSWVGFAVRGVQAQRPGSKEDGFQVCVRLPVRFVEDRVVLGWKVIGRFSGCRRDDSGRRISGVRSV